MKELVLNMFEAMYDFRMGIINAGEVVKEKLEVFYDNLGYKAMDSGIRGKIWDAVIFITAVLNFIICIPFIPVAFVLVDLPYDILYVVIYLNHWDID